jgi:thymidylate synthase
MKQYHDALKHILKNGEEVNDRTGVGTRTVFGYQMRFDLSKGFPAVTTKRLAWKSVVSELLWFLEGGTDERRLAEILYNDTRENLTDKTTIWTANAD